jgi:hypothetical protein
MYLVMSQAFWLVLDGALHGEIPKKGTKGKEIFMTGASPIDCFGLILKRETLSVRGGDGWGR